MPSFPPPCPDPAASTSTCAKPTGPSGAFFMAGPRCRRRKAVPSRPSPPGAALFAALVAALWAYDGGKNVSMVASEIQNPQRNLPLALIGGTAGVMALYLLANAAYFRILPASGVAASDLVAADMMRKIF